VVRSSNARWPSPAATDEGRGRDGGVDEARDRNASRSCYAEEQTEPLGGPEAGHGEEDLIGAVRQALDQSDEVGVAEICASHARGKGPTHRLGVERVEVGIVDRTGPQEGPRGGGRPRQDLASLEERHGRAFRLGPRLALTQGQQAGVVHLQGECSHQGTRRLWSKRSSR
jgi:hypothetical protein